MTRIIRKLLSVVLIRLFIGNKIKFIHVNMKWTAYWADVYRKAVKPILAILPYHKTQSQKPAYDSSFRLKVCPLNDLKIDPIVKLSLAYLWYFSYYLLLEKAKSEPILPKK
jgi:hypothetical protein